MVEIYDKNIKLTAVISHNPLILMAMSRFGISLGFGEKTVGHICKEQGVDCDTFLSVANFISFGRALSDKVSLPSLMSYLASAHEYFLDFCLPMIRRKLIDAIGLDPTDRLSLLILKFYDEYVQEVRKHMEYENAHVFTYVRALIDGHKDPAYGIAVFASHHHSIHDKLQELKDILIRYLPHRDNNLLNVVLFDIIQCENDLMTHCRVEDQIFVPAVRRLEESLKDLPVPEAELKPEPAPSKDEPISARERDIIECVARGLSNKEIADALCISVNTVTTHRRNIAQKLQIHSPAGLTLYAVINGILRIDDIQPQKF